MNLFFWKWKSQRQLLRQAKAKAVVADAIGMDGFGTKRFEVLQWNLTIDWIFTLETRVQELEKFHLETLAALIKLLPPSEAKSEIFGTKFYHTFEEIEAFSRELARHRTAFKKTLERK